MLKQHWAMRNAKEDMLELGGGAPYCPIKVSGSVIAVTWPHVPASRGLIKGLLRYGRLISRVAITSFVDC